ncbi:helix-turn-helix transcriptional regulator [Acinetobacter pollinis]|uniref:WYL domain-containing protein n=1 Tax=Acinetobacter pollinis TaxID=2605270 RepID=A0ABU6DUM8_9GAMM|nr:WYL domain-containing transcriptional regulator [Acinetobacter pollinis]MEB5477554.1 WYL domain-containing protein [Acinetobacter pollinis]
MNNKVHLTDRMIGMLIKFSTAQHLDEQSLAEEYGVTERTIRRDIKKFKDSASFQKYFSKKSDDKYFFISNNAIGNPKAKDIHTFAKISKIAKDIPSMSPASIHNNIQKDIYEIKELSIKEGTVNKYLFHEVERAILHSFTMTITYSNTERVIEPYKLVLSGGHWYIYALHNEIIKKYRLSRISNYKINQQKFQKDKCILDQINEGNNIWFDPNISIDIQLLIQTDFYSEFKQIPDFQSHKFLDKGDGTTLISLKVHHKDQIKSIIRFWIPYITVISPKGLQQEIDYELQEYLSQRVK